MTVKILEPHGFCMGVKSAIEKALRALSVSGSGTVYCLHELVHNERIIEDLGKQGMVFVDSIDRVPESGKVLFSAHGVSPEIRARATELRLHVIDATCPFVARVHRQVADFASRGLAVVVIGHRDHVEVRGIVGEARVAGASVFVVSSTADVAELPISCETRLGVVSQTTLAVDVVQVLIRELQARFTRIEVPAAASVCTATQDRQRAVQDFVEERACAGIVVVGSTSSSNTRRLVEVAESRGVRAWQVNSCGELSSLLPELRESSPRGGVLGLTSGASTPEILLSDIARELEESFAW